MRVRTRTGLLLIALLALVAFDGIALAEDSEAIRERIEVPVEEVEVSAPADHKTPAVEAAPPEGESETEQKEDDE